MLKWKPWALAFVLATGAFWLMFAKDLPQSAAADPGGAFSLLDIQIPTSLPLAEGGNAS